MFKKKNTAKQNEGMDFSSKPEKTQRKQKNVKTVGVRISSKMFAIEFAMAKC